METHKSDCKAEIEVHELYCRADAEVRKVEASIQNQFMFAMIAAITKNKSNINEL